MLLCLDASFFCVWTKDVFGARTVPSWSMLLSISLGRKGFGIKTVVCSSVIELLAAKGTTENILYIWWLI